MRLRKIKDASTLITDSPLVITDPKQYQGQWHLLFKHQYPLYLEIGMGKGKFIIEMALKYPSINFIGLEQHASIILLALKKMSLPLPSNLLLVWGDANQIDEYFKKEISSIFLNFSDPWPKRRHLQRRLTSPTLLTKYENIFKDKKQIFLKTDNIGFFNYSLKTLKNFNYKINNKTNDLDDTDYNIKTEYEVKFRALGIKINYLEATKQ